MNEERLKKGLDSNKRELKSNKAITLIAFVISTKCLHH